MPREIHVSEPISVAEAHELLRNRAEEAKNKREELSYMQSVALEHAVITARTTGEAAKKLISALIEKYRISNLGAISLANTLPNTIDEIRQVLGPESKRIDTEQVEEILTQLNDVERIDSDFSILEYDNEEDESEEFEKELPSDIPDI